MAIDALMNSAQVLRSLKLVDCPRLTDKVVIAMFESDVVWGKKRNTSTQSVQSLDLRLNPNYTAQMLTFVSTAIPGLKSLDITHCPNIGAISVFLLLLMYYNYLWEFSLICLSYISINKDLTYGMKELETLRKLEDLRIGNLFCTLHHC